MVGCCIWSKRRSGAHESRGQSMMSTVRLGLRPGRSPPASAPYHRGTRTFRCGTTTTKSTSMLPHMQAMESYENPIPLASNFEDDQLLDDAPPFAALVAGRISVMQTCLQRNAFLTDDARPQNRPALQFSHGLCSHHIMCCGRMRVFQSTKYCGTCSSST